MKYTDIAKEACDLLENTVIDGVNRDSYKVNDIDVEIIEIVSPKSAELLNKSQGKYISITSQYNFRRDKNYHNDISKVLADSIKKLLPRDYKLTLVVGLGNRSMTPDALGPRTIDKIMVTKHIIDIMPDKYGKIFSAVCAVTPSVYGVTGIESADYISAICGKINPDCVIAVDSLAAAQWSRINDTIQLTDTGITPGAGVGNRRSGLNKETLGVPVIAVGIPVVVRLSQICDICDDKDMLVTPKNIDVIVEDSSGIIASGINLALHDNISQADIDNFMF